MLERMPVMDKNSPGHTNGDVSGELIKESDVPKPKPAETAFPSESASQVMSEYCIPTIDLFTFSLFFVKGV